MKDIKNYEKEKMYSLNEIGLLPSSEPTDISSRSQVNPFTEDEKLPIFVSPMTSVLCKENYLKFSENKVMPILPRNCRYEKFLKGVWQSVSLQEFETLANSDAQDFNGISILVDIANGHIGKLYGLVDKFKTKWPKSIVMIGNIAHPNIYKYCCYCGADYVRVSVGTGSVCSTSVVCGINASHLWLIEGIKDVKEELKNEYYGDSYFLSKHPNFKFTKVIADGGVNTLDKAIKCLSIGYDYIMVGKMFAQCEEACGQTIITNEGKLRKYYGMASEQGQIDISGGANKSPEGIETFVPVNTTVKEFVTKFEAALRSTMSYVGAHNLQELRDKCQYRIMTEAQFKSYYK